MTLACEDAKSKLVEVVIVADVDAEKHIDDSWCRFGHIELSFCSDFEHKVSRFRQDFETDVWSLFCY